MKTRQVLLWAGLLLIGPIVGVGGIVLYERDIQPDTAGLLAGIGWLFTAVVVTWLTVKTFRALPVRYSLWAMGLAIPIAAVSAVLHGVVYALWEVEEPLFFLLAIFGAPLLLIGGFIGWLTRPRPEGPRAIPPAGHGLAPR